MSGASRRPPWRAVTARRVSGVGDLSVLVPRGPDGESEFRSVTHHLAQSGLTVEHPKLGCGMLLDVAGEQVRLPVGRILELVGLSVGPLCLQLWLSADTGVVCHVRYVAPDTQVLTFVLGGLTDNEREQATDAVQQLIQRELNRTVALLVDLGGETADEDDDALVLLTRCLLRPEVRMSVTGGTCRA